MSSEMRVRCRYTRMVPIKELMLAQHPDNPNDHSEEQIERLAEIMRYQGVRHPIVISTLSGRMTKGHGRLYSAIHNKWEKYPVEDQDYDDADQEYADVVADNAIALWAELNLSAVNEQVQHLGPDFEINMLGLKDFEIEPADKYTGDEDAIPEVKELYVKRSELWRLGGHRLLCGDSTSADDVARLMDGEKAALVFTDPPYNLASETTMYAGDGSAWFGKALEKLKESEWDKNFDIVPALNNMFEASAEDCAYYIWTSHFLVPRIWDFFSSKNCKSSYCVWCKTNPMPSMTKRHWTFATELCVYATRGKHTFNFPSEGNALNYWVIAKKSDGTHPTQKIIEVCEGPILRTSRLGDIVLDGFSGSGSTLIACEKTNRKCFGMEIDPHYCTVILDRWANYTGKDPVREDGMLWSDLKAEKQVKIEA